jgi:hypothetical protein
MPMPASSDTEKEKRKVTSGSSGINNNIII